MSWKQAFAKAQRALPKSASPKERGAATKRAAAAYRKGTRTNPSGGGLIKLAVIGVGAYYGIKFLAKQTKPPEAPAADPKQTGM